MSNVYKNACGPDFIGVGIPKAGTTWLDALLRTHPQIWLPPIKELHFFDEYFESPRNLGLRRYFSHDPWIRARWRRYLKSVTLNTLRYPSIERFSWASKFLFSRRDFQKYAELFSRNERVRGEITPDYCVLPPLCVRQIHDAFPNSKILFMIRNPSDRAWSHCRMELFARNNRSVSEVSTSEIQKFLFDDEGVRRRSCYSFAIKTWLDIYGRQSIWIGLYDDLISRPVELARSVLHFLGVAEESPDISVLAHRQVHKGKSITLNDQIREQLIRYFRDEVAALDKLLPEYQLPLRWGEVDT